MTIARVQLLVNGSEEGLRTSGIGVSQSTPRGHHFEAQVIQLLRLDLKRTGDLPQRVEAHNDSEKHRHQMSPPVKPLDIPLSAVVSAEFDHSLLSKKSNNLGEDRLSGKMCTFAHG